MKLKVVSRDMVLLTPGEMYDMPDEIATQLMARGSAEPIAVEEPETKKEHALRMKQEKADAK